MGKRSPIRIMPGGLRIWCIKGLGSQSVSVVEYGVGSHGSGMRLEVREIDVKSHQARAKGIDNRLLGPWTVASVTVELRSWGPDVSCNLRTETGIPSGVTGLGLEAIGFGVWNQGLEVMESGVK